jgi:hypothetical protein
MISAPGAVAPFRGNAPGYTAYGAFGACLPDISSIFSVALATDQPRAGFSLSY